MKEKELIVKAKKWLTKRDGVAWSGARWNDVFSIFDVIYMTPDGMVGYYQVSTKAHKWDRRVKIEKWCRDHGTTIPYHSYLMLWDYRLDDFIIEKL